MEKNLPYRPCAGIMLLNADNKVFVAKRIDTKVEAWQMPQGGIDEGEDTREAALRELEEETGINNVTIIDEYDGWLTYDLPDELYGKVWKGRYGGQSMKWYVMRFNGQDSDINIETAHPEFAEWKWSDMRDLPDMIVPFKRDIYQKLADKFAHLAG
ncbi:RNA pyrophosphohydrolase [Pseudemcibacter aquimaris]|uniref:RNA pyrophosphohydrolase n=1 Tax=Pseudemcibacter aquimaris TaxID=2857064 RepID=UPI00237D71DB|nr:RNA pyrophosphohydrolase [Pseudemcibacter aquimaris]MCC3861640.1 RNA pyrophosphohydrolase [Pseudemcibacter aquimaris]WDU58411.1 RNA pyrophosphohydrolase [Pseudemcibacter aquimaris]